MFRHKALDEPYAGRRADGAVINCTVDREVKDLLVSYAGGKGGKRIGAFITRLVYTHDAQQRERQRVQSVLQTAIEKDTTAG